MQIAKEQANRIAKLASIVGESGFDFSSPHFVAITPSDTGITAMFMNSTITGSLRIPTETPIDEGVCLPKKEFFRFNEATQGDVVTIKPEVENDIARIQCGKSKMVARTIPLSTFPFPTVEESDTKIMVSTGHFQAALTLCYSLASVSLESEHLDIHLAADSELRCFTTDGKNLAHAEIPLPLGHEEALRTTGDFDISISVKTAQTLVKLLAEVASASVYLLVGKHMLTVSDTEQEWAFHCLLKADTKSIPWRKLIENSAKDICIIENMEDLHESMDVCMSLSDDKHAVLRMDVQESLSLELENEKGSAKGVFDNVDLISPHNGFVPFLPLKALFSFCKKFSHGTSGKLHLQEIQLPNSKPLKWIWAGEGLSNVIMITAAYTKN